MGLPIVKPPWGRITAIDMNTGEHVWMVANGDTPDDAASPLPQEFLKDVPSEARTILQQMYAMVSGPMRSPIWDAFRPEHLTAVIESRREDSAREHVNQQRDRVFQLIYAVLILGATFGILVFAVVADARDLLIPVLTLVLGFGSGVAVGRSKR